MSDNHDTNPILFTIFACLLMVACAMVLTIHDKLPPYNNTQELAK